MRRADRLFQIVHLLRQKKLTTARALADRLQVSERTIYRDIQDLVLSGVQIDGEAGVGYILRQDFDLPPLMFNREEIEALVIGARMIKGWLDSELSLAATHALGKIEAVIPDSLKKNLKSSHLHVPDFHAYPVEKLEPVRKAIADQQKIELQYQDEKGKSSLRTVNPLGLFYWGGRWTVLSWCNLREDFRNFRIDRIKGLKVTSDKFHSQNGQTLEDFFKLIGVPKKDFNF